MFMAGLINIMLETILLIVLISLISIYVIYNKKRKFNNILSVGLIFFIIGTLFFSALLSNHHLYAYDDFSHWALVIKQMLQNNRLPNFSDDLIGFTSYPTGEAGFIYFIGKILGETEGMMLIGKSIFSIACITPIFGLIKNKKKSSYLILCLFVLLVLLSNNGLSTLYVDSLLTIITLGMTAIILNSYLENNINRAIIPLSLSTSVLVIMKNSGLLFAIILIVLFALAKLKSKDFKYPLLSSLAGLSPFVYRKLWDSHTKFTFVASEETKHSLSIKNYQNVIANKTPEQIKMIVNQMIERNYKAESFDIQIVLIVLISLFALILIKKYILKNAKPKYEITLFALLLLLYVLYQLGLLFTYLYSMPTGEAMALASYYRYNLTMSLYIFGVFIMYILIVNNSVIKKNMIINTLVIGLLSLSLGQEKEEIISTITNKSYKDSVRVVLTDLKNQFSRQEEEYYVFYVSDREKIVNNGYLNYMIRYDFGTTNFKVVLKDNIDVLSKYIGNENSTLLVLYEDTAISEFLANNKIQNLSNIVDMSKENQNE